MSSTHNHTINQSRRATGKGVTMTQEQVTDPGENLYGTMEMHNARGERVDCVQEATRIHVCGETITAHTPDAQLYAWAEKAEKAETTESHKMGYNVVWEPNFREWYGRLREYCRENTPGA